MIYKLSDREKILLKYAGILLLLISFVALTNYVTANLRESKDELFEKLNNFNQSKQLLAQIKVIKNNADIVLSRDEFLKLIINQGLSYETEGNSILIPGLNDADALGLLDLIEDNNIQLNNYNLALQQDNLVLMTLDIDE
ncbi:MAG: hypothetical protein ACJ0GO_04755 [Gammaproteobacteria bacterium]|jgi:hypothetical protein|tara:strand:+ start:174 stop:593 length:420 start_codon:yes stop_codon:yes gene_type:complete